MSIVPTELLDIGEVAARSGLATALRYYERRGLIEPVTRHGLRRQYAPDVLRRLAFVTETRAAGFSIDEIRDVLDASPDDADLRALATRKVSEIEVEIERLRAVSQRLRHVSRCRSQSLFDCPRFTQGLVAE
ncbi:MAG: MerR family transcriptional regulator [Acidimicrobiia bacterium]|nr:MerR family transcriptional regulator [Acidimicrobiia bacterium]